MEENKQKYKQYAEIRKELDNLKESYKEDTKELDEKIKLYNAEKKKLYESKYKPQLDNAEREAEELKSKIVEEWDSEEKTISVESVGRFTLKKTKKLEIFDKKLLVEDMIERKLINNAIKSFNEPFLKNIIDSGVDVPGAKVEDNKVLSFTKEKPKGE